MNRRQLLMLARAAGLEPSPTMPAEDLFLAVLETIGILRAQSSAAQRSGSSGVIPRKSPDLLMLTEVAEICRVPVGTIRQWCREGRLPSLRPGRMRMVRRQDLDRFMRDALENDA
jgi:excisionase family DNA binding protein